MKNLMKFMTWAALVVFLAMGCTPDYQGQYQKSVNAYFGTVSQGHYSNSWLKAEMDLPADWHVQEDSVKAVVVSAGEQMKDQKALDDGVKNIETLAVYNLLQLFKNPLENQQEFNPSLVMMVERIDGKGIPDAAAYLEASRTVMGQRQMPMGFTQKLDAAVDTMDIGGQEFAHLPIVIETSLFQINQDYYALMLEDRMLGIMISWRDEAEKTEMMNSMRTLKISD